MDGKKHHATAPYDMETMPPGIKYIIGNEAAERFSFYGMKAILIVFMTEYLRSSTGKLATLSNADATFWQHTFVASAYFFPLFGAWIADRYLGKYKTILYISVIYCLGHLALALDETWMGLAVGLSLIAIGTGGIKPCVSAHVGDQFGVRNKHLLPRVFGWFYLSINLGAVISQYLTPILLLKFGPAVAFGVPGILMILATFLFWLGRNVFVHIPPRGEELVKELSHPEGWKSIRGLIPIYFCIAAFWCLFDQTASRWVLQAKFCDRNILGWEILPSQLQIINPLFILILVPTFTFVIYPLMGKFFTVTPLRKIGIGMALAVLSFCVSAGIESNIQGGKIVRYKLNEADNNFQVLSAVDPYQFGTLNLIDGNSDSDPWISELDAGSKEQPDSQEKDKHVVIELREFKQWPIDQVILNHAQDIATYNQKRKTSKPDFIEIPAPKACPTQAVIFVGPSPIGPWTQLEDTTLNAEDSKTVVDLAPTDAKYVRIDLLTENSSVIAMNEIQILSKGSNVSATGHLPSISWQVLAYFILTAAEVLVSITCLEFSYAQAPNSMKSIVMSVYLLSIAAGNEFTAVVNAFVENADGTSRLPGANYYWFFSGVMLLATLLYIVIAKRYRGSDYIQGADSELYSAEAKEEGTTGT